MILSICNSKVVTKLRSDKNLPIVVRLIAFCILFVELLTFIEPLFQMNYQRMTIPIYQEIALAKEDQYDVFFLGSSHVWRGIDPEFIERILPITDDLFWLPGANTDNSFFLLEKAVKAGKTPKVVVLDSFSLLDSIGNYQGLMYVDNFDIKNRLLMIKDAITIFPPEEQLSMFSVALHNHDLWQKKYIFNPNLEAFSQFYLHVRNNSRLNELWDFFYKEDTDHLDAITSSMLHTNQNEITPTLAFDKYTKNQLLRFIYYCRAHDIKVIIVDVPTLNTSGADLNPIREFCQNEGIPFYEYDAYFRDNFSDRYVFFSEGGKNSHMNENGKRLLTADFIIPMLAKELNLEYDQKALDESTKLIQAGLNVTGADTPATEKLTFTLTPLNPELEFNYHWMLKTDKTDLIFEQNGPDNTLTISKNKWGAPNFQIEVEVTSPQVINQSIVFTIPLY